MKQHETYMKQTPHKKTKISLKLVFFSFSITNFSHEMFLIKVEIQIPTYFIFFLFNTQNVAKFCSRQFPVFVLRLLSFFLFSVNTYNMTTFSWNHSHVWSGILQRRRGWWGTVMIRFNALRAYLLKLPKGRALIRKNGSCKEQGTYSTLKNSWMCETKALKSIWKRSQNWKTD